MEKIIPKSYGKPQGMTLAHGLGTISTYMKMGPNNSMQRILLLGKTKYVILLNEASQRVNLPLVLEKLASLLKTGLCTFPRSQQLLGEQAHFPVSSLRIWSLLAIQVGEGNGTPLQYSCLENP